MKRIVVGISGASGIPLAIRILKELKENQNVETHLVYSHGAELTARLECSMDMVKIESLADVHYDNSDTGAAIASGTYQTEGMIIVPCSMKTVSGISHGYSENLLLRAADVTIKEQRRLVLAVRETPLSSIHLENMLYLSRLQNVVIMPPLVTYYNSPDTIGDMETHIAGKLLKWFDVEAAGFQCWKQ